MQMQPLSQQEKDFIAANPKLSASKLAFLMGRSVKSVIYNREKMGQYYIHPWNDEKDAILVEMMNDGCSQKGIAKRLKTTIAAVSSRLTRLDRHHIKNPRAVKTWTTVDSNRMFEMYQAGASYAEIAKMLKRSLSSVRGALSYHRGSRINVNKEFTQKRKYFSRMVWNKEMDDFLKQQLELEFSIRDIGKKLGLNYDSTYRRAIRIGAIKRGANNQR